MNETQNYLQMMIESLKKKDNVLTKIITKNEAQSECVVDKEYGDIDWDRFNILISEKDVLINRINELDQGFESLYERIRYDVTANKDIYKSEIKTMQELIEGIVEKGTKIQTQEERNRAKIEKVLLGAKKEIKQSRKSMQVVSSYYKSMSNPSGEIDATMDRKK